jgi:hypothetical protein
MICHCTPERQCELCEAMLDDMPKNKPTVYILHGVADRDYNELVCMVFPNMKDVQSFIKSLPGKYRVAKYEGIDYDDIKYISTKEMT